MAATPDLAGRESPGEGPLFEADFISQGIIYCRHIFLYRNLHNENVWTSIAPILAHGVSQPLLKTTLRLQIQIVTQSGVAKCQKPAFFYIGTLGLIDLWTSGSRRDKT